MAPVFSLVWDEDVSAQTALTFPELYKDLMKVLYIHMHPHSVRTKAKPFYMITPIRTSSIWCASGGTPELVQTHPPDDVTSTQQEGRTCFMDDVVGIQSL